MSDKIEEDNDDNWIFDSLVNFLHGNLWKMPVLGFIEEKSVVFDPDSHTNLTDEKEEEFRKIHDEYKALVDFMLSSFMEDLQVTPEQVEEACQVRENQTHIPESHITKVALEQLQAAEDFNVFRRVMTRKNIDLQLQSLELLVSKYGVLSPSLRSEGVEEGDGGEDDFLQVVIRYCGESGVFYSANANKTAKGPITCTTHQPSSSPKLSQQNQNELNESADILRKKEDIETKLRHIENTAESASTIMQPHPHTKIDPCISNVPKIPTERDGLDTSNVAAPAFFSASSQLNQQDLDDMEKAIRRQQDGGGSVERAPSMDHHREAPIEHHPQHSLSEVKIQKKDTKHHKKSVKFDETIVAQISTVAPEQHRILTSVRKALEVDADSDVEAASMAMDLTGSEEDIEKRRAYLRAQRDKLVSFKKRERERQLAAASGEGDGQTRPKSARAAQIAMRTPPSATNSKSLAARLALAARLKQELLDK